MKRPHPAPTARRLRARVLAPLALIALGCVACGSEDGTDVDEPPTDYTDLRVDTNRDGIIDAADNEGEDVWTIDSGAVFLANLDDDDQDGVRDAEDTYVNLGPENTADEWDLARVMIQPYAGVPADATGWLDLEPADIPHTRVFKKIGEGNWELVMGNGAAGGGANVAITADEIRAGVELGIEGLYYTGTPEAGAWDGVANISWRILPAGSETPIPSEANPEGIDYIQMRIAPWIMVGNLTPVIDTIFSSTISAVTVAGIETAVNDDAGAVGYWKLPPSVWDDHWTEDIFQTGYSSTPLPGDTVHGMRVAMPRPWGRAPNNVPDPSQYLPWRFLQDNHVNADLGAFKVYNTDFSGDTFDSYGNHDLIPPYQNGADNYPYGRIIHGSGVIQETKTFYDAQLVQSPAMVVDTSWLIVGHVDEVFSYVPANTDRGWKLLVGSPTLARQMLEQWQAEGHGEQTMFTGKFWDAGRAATISINDALADTELMNESQQSQGHIDGMLDAFIAATGLQPDEIIEIPFLIENYSGGWVAYNPGTVNSLVYNNTIVIPDPFGPNINGADGFAKDLQDRLGTGNLGVGREGAGLKVFFADDWDWYHRLLGEVHCGTNQSGPPQASVKWWEAAQ